MRKDNNNVIMKTSNAKKSKPSTKKQKQIFEKNKDWIFEGELKDLSGKKFEEFYEEFKRLGGKDKKEIYKRNLNIFYKITLNPFVYGDLIKVSDNDRYGYWKYRQESWDCWCGYLGDNVDANVYYDSVNNVAAYT